MKLTQIHIDSELEGFFTVGVSSISHSDAGYEYTVVFVASSDENGDDVMLTEHHLTDRDHESIMIKISNIVQDDDYHDYS